MTCRSLLATQRLKAAVRICIGAEVSNCASMDRNPAPEWIDDVAFANRMSEQRYRNQEASKKRHDGDFWSSRTASQYQRAVEMSRRTAFDFLRESAATGEFFKRVKLTRDDAAREWFTSAYAGFCGLLSP